MTFHRLTIAMGLLGSILGFLGFAETAANGQSKVIVNEHVSFERQLETFNKLGFELNPGTSISDIDRWGNKKEFEDQPYVMLYITLGQTIEREAWTPLTDRVWDFDTEAIEDHGAYIEIRKNLERISRGEVKFENLKDYVDVEKEIAWVSFTFHGKNYKWDLKVDDDWADPMLFSKVADLVRTNNTKGRYTYFDTGGQDAVIGFEIPEGKAAIVKATGLKIEWLN